MGTAPATGTTRAGAGRPHPGGKAAGIRPATAAPAFSCDRRNPATAAKAQQRSAQRFAMVESCCALRSPVPVRGCRPMLARMTLLWLGLLTATAAAETAPACWAPDDLVHRQGEERVQRGVAQARITAPKRTLAEYSPVAARSHTACPAAAGQEARRPHVRSLRAAVRNLGLPGRYRRLPAQQGDQGHVLHWRQVDALPSRAHPAAHGRPHV